MPELDTFLGELDAVKSSVSSGYFHLVSTISYNSKLQLAPSIRSHKLWCQARTLLTPVPMATKISASKLIHYFSSHPAAFGFWSSTPPDNITLISANRKANQSLSEFQTGIGAAAHATLDTNQLISNPRVVLVDTLSCLPNSEGGVRTVSKVHELLLKVHDILDNAVSKQVGNFAHILGHVLILLPGSVKRSGLHSSLFFTLSRKWFFLVRLVCMAVSTGLWHRPEQVLHGIVSLFSI